MADITKRVKEFDHLQKELNEISVVLKDGKIWQHQENGELPRNDELVNNSNILIDKC